MTTELKPCPFCGSEDLDGPHLASIGDRCSPYWWIDCKACPAGMEFSASAYPVDAVAAWNQRSKSETQIYAMEFLKKQSDMLCHLLAVIHRDGGQYTHKVGIRQACADAETIVSGAFEQIEAIDALIQQATLAEREACALACEDELDKWDGKDTWECGVMHCAESIRARSGR